MRACSAVILSVVAVSAQSLACTPSEGYRIVDELPVGLEARNQIALAPALRLESLRRGFDDGQSDSCSTFGELTLVVEDSITASAAVYFFEVTGGGFPERIFPNQLTAPIELANKELGFVFHWLDLPAGADRLDPIDATITVRRISALGTASEPTTLRIVHGGGPLPPKAYAGTIAMLKRLTQIAIALVIPLFIYAYVRQRRRWQKELREFQGAPEPKTDTDHTPPT